MVATEFKAARAQFRRRISLVMALAAILTAGFVALSGNTVIASGPDQVTVRAKGTTGTEQFQLWINDEIFSTWTATTEWTSFSHQVDAPLEVKSAVVRFINDNGSERDLHVDFIDVGGTRLESEAAGTRSTGTWTADGGCRERQSTSQSLHCNGHFDYRVPVGTVLGRPPSVGATVEVRALGTSAAEEMHLRVNGQPVAAFTPGTEWEVLTFDMPAGERIDSAEVSFVNDGPGRDLRVDWLAVDGVRYQSESTSTDAKGNWVGGRCYEGASESEWLRCGGWFRYSLGLPQDDPRPPSTQPPLPPSTIVPETTTTTSTTTSTTTTSTTTTTRPPRNGRYSIAQVIDGTISSGDGSNPNEEAPMGRHDAPLSLPQGWNWAQGPTRNSQWGQLGSGGSQYVEWRCAVIPERGHTPPVPFRVNVQNGAYYQFANGNWNKAFDVDLTGGNRGAYLGVPGRENQNPFDSGSHGQIQWRREADGSFSAPWNSGALMMHFWASKRQAPTSGQTAEFLTSEVRLQQPDGQTVDLSRVKVLFQCGVDYYASTGGQGTKVPGPGIAKYHRATSSWKPGLWVTLPANAPAGSVGDFRTWLSKNPPPNVGS